MGVSYNRLWKMLIDKNMKRIENAVPHGDQSGKILSPGWEKKPKYVIQ